MTLSASPGASPPGIDTVRVTQWLGETLGLVPPLEWTVAGRGRSNLTYVVTDAAGRDLVLRRPPLGALSESAHDVAREHRLLEALHALGQPVPRPRALCTDTAVTGAPFLVMERIAGTVPDSPETAERAFTEEARTRAGLDFARTLAGLHAVDPVVAGLSDLGRGGHDFAARQVRRWTRQWGAMGVRDERVDGLAVRLAGAIPPQDEVTIVHGDFTIWNVVLAPDGSIAAVLDWELATLGDPIADLAWMLMWWAETEDEVMPGAEPVSLARGFPPRSRLVDAYVERTGRSTEHLPFWSVLSRWKLAVIVEGVHQRWRANPANGGREAHTLDGARDRVVDAALEAAQRAGL